MEEFLPYIIVCPLVFIAGFIDAIAGGGGLISLPAYLIAGLPAHAAIGTNKLSSAMGTTVATIQYARKGFVEWKMAIPAAALSLFGAWIGSHLTLLVPEDYFMIVMLILLPLTALYVIKKKELTDKYSNDEITGKTWAIVSLLAFAIGLYDGFYGPGTGTFLMLLLTGWAHLSLSRSAGITKIINLSSNIMALSVFLLNGTVMIKLGLIAAIFSIAGNYLGARSFVKHGNKIVRPVIILIILIFMTKIILERFVL